MMQASMELTPNLQNVPTRSSSRPPTPSGQLTRKVTKQNKL